MSIDERIMELESRVAFQEDALDKLSDVIANQDQEIIKLKEVIKILHKQLNQLEYSNENAAPPVDQPPPHY